MALINRIEVVNYLCEGWQPSMGIQAWRPLWPANLITLGGQSTAIQVPNGCGKTSVTSAILYLLSRDRTLKRQFLERCAPAGTVSTHVRVEFAILLDEDITQRDLMTPDPESCPAQTYVLGVCGNRGDDTPQFYRYPGILEDAPASRMEGSVIQFSTSDALRTAVKKIRGSQWGGWDSSAEWSKVVGEFMSPEVVKQNVQFHRSGAGDASATFSKVTPGAGERFDEAYFRQVVAPQLLSNMMGESAEEDERSIEDTVLNSMNRFIGAKLQVERKRAYLERREAMEAQFQPVLEAAGGIRAADLHYQNQLQRLATDAAFLERFATSKQGRLRGVPRPLSELSFNPDVRACLEAMVLDKDGSVLIESAGIARLLGVPTGHLNQLASRQSASRSAVSATAASAQVLDLYCDIKISGGSGGRRKAAVFYNVHGARELVSRRGDSADEQLAALAEAFTAAQQWVDTNPFRHEHHRLLARRALLKEQIAAAEQAGQDASERKERLEEQVHERAENEGAFRDFCAHLSLLPEHLHEAPGDVPQWLTAQTNLRADAVVQHYQRVGELTAGWDELRAVRNELGLVSIDARIAELTDEGTRAEQARVTMEAEAAKAQSRRDEAVRQLESARERLGSVALELGLLEQGQEPFEQYIAIFGDEDPIKVSPPVKDHQALLRRRTQVEGMRRGKNQALERHEELGRGATAFRQLFGQVEPHRVTPQRDLELLQESHRAADQLFGLHQPLVESLEQHREHSALDPSAWLEETDRSHADALATMRAAEGKAAELDRQLRALDSSHLVGDPAYAAAHEELVAWGIRVTRVRDTVLGLGLPKDRTLPLLASFGPLLDAPVVANLAVADAALLALSAGEHDVPLVLLDPLLAALKSDNVHETPSAASLHFLVGAKSRRVRAIVDPQALEEERADLRKRHAEQTALVASAKAAAQTLNPHTPAYQRALRAQDAVKRDSTAKAAAALAEMKALEPKIAAAQKLTTPEALRNIHDAIKYEAAGGAESAATLAQELEALTADVVNIEEHIRETEPRVTPEAIVAHAGAKKFALAGGRSRLVELRSSSEQLKAEMVGVQAAVNLAEPELAAKKLALTEAQAQELAFMKTYLGTLARLKRAAKFESDGSAAFMNDQAEKADHLIAARNALDPLKAINYVRAKAFKDHQGQDEAELQRQIGLAKAEREASANTARELTSQNEALDGLLQGANAAAEALHELVYYLTERHRALAPFEPDLGRREGGPSPYEAHHSYRAANELRYRLEDWKPADGPFDRTLIAALREDIESIDVAKTGQEVASARRQAERAREVFESGRSEFCAKARATEGGAFSEAEIEAISHAKTANDLQELARIGARLRHELEEEKSELQELDSSASTIETESINTLTRLVEGCRGNLTTMNQVMARNPNARFIIATKIISTEDIKKLMLDLRDHIEARQREAHARTTLNKKAASDSTLSADVRQALIDRIFMEPSVEFRHVGMWDGKTQPIQSSLSEGQKAALQMMWLIKESEYHLECAVRRHLGGGSKRKLRSRSQRVLFFDGLFSNLTDRALIDEAFKGLGEADSNLQLIGLIHNPEYRNNAAIFPSLVIGRRVGRRDVEGERSFVRFEDGRHEGSMGLATFMLKRPARASEVAPRG